MHVVPRRVRVQELQGGVVNNGDMSPIKAHHLAQLRRLRNEFAERAAEQKKKDAARLNAERALAKQRAQWGHVPVHWEHS